MNIESQYIDILKSFFTPQAIRQENRTGTDVFKIPPRMIQHDMSDGSFPLLTTKRVAWKVMKTELEGFIKGVTSKAWYQERGCNIWNEWCNPQKVGYSKDPEIQQMMADEDDLGPCLYGASWRNFHDPRAQGVKQHVDQLAIIVNRLKTNPECRRMVCTAWNPLGIDHTALAWCHYSWQVMKRGEYLDLIWNQRSVDSFLGLPFNIASYGLLLHLLAREAGLKPGILSGSLADLHLYENHREQALTQIDRTAYQLPYIETEPGSIFTWSADDTLLFDYKCHGALKAEVAI